MRWMLCTTQIIETADDMSREQLVEELVKQRVVRGAADNFSLEPIEEAELFDDVAYDECKAPNGAAGDNEKECDTTETTAEK